MTPTQQLTIARDCIQCGGTHRATVILQNNTLKFHYHTPTNAQWARQLQCPNATQDWFYIGSLTTQLDRKHMISIAQYLNDHPEILNMPIPEKILSDILFYTLTEHTQNPTHYVRATCLALHIVIHYPTTREEQEHIQGKLVHTVIRAWNRNEKLPSATRIRSLFHRFYQILRQHYICPDTLTDETTLRMILKDDYERDCGVVHIRRVNKDYLRKLHRWVKIIMQGYNPEGDTP